MPNIINLTLLLNFMAEAGFSEESVQKTKQRAYEIFLQKIGEAINTALTDEQRMEFKKFMDSGKITEEITAYLKNTAVDITRIGQQAIESVFEEIIKEATPAQFSLLKQKLQ